MNIYKRIKIARKAKNIKQTELAKQVEMTRSSVCSWELNKSVPGLHNLIKLSEALNVSIDWLCTGDESNILTKTLNTNEQTLLNIITTMPQEQQKALLLLLDK